MNPQTASSMVAVRRRQSADSPFLISGGTAATFAAVDVEAASLAASLARLGVERGDRIALVLPSCPESVVSFFAAVRLGALVVPLDPNLLLPDLGYVLRHVGAACLVTDDRLRGQDHLQVREELLDGSPELAHIVTIGGASLWYDDRIHRWSDLLSAGQRRVSPGHRARPSDGLAILYTTCTRGKPRGVELAHSNIAHAAHETARALSLGPDDVLAGLTATHTPFALGPGMLGAAAFGAALALQADSDPDAIMDDAERHGATILCGTPHSLESLLRSVERRGGPPTTLRLCLSTGAPVRYGLARRIEATLRVPLATAYSLPETASTLAMTRPGDPARKRHWTVGRPIGQTTVRLEAHDGSTVPTESVGRICVRGPGVMQGYHRQPRETASVLDSDDFLRTEDVGMLDEEGYLHLIGRRGETVMRGGRAVRSREVERCLMAHPAVDRATVIGLADEILGEAACACVVRVEGGVLSEREIREWVAAKLAQHRVPDVVSFMEDLPLTETGQVERHELRRRLDRAWRTGPGAQRRFDDPRLD